MVIRRNGFDPEPVVRIQGITQHSVQVIVRPGYRVTIIDDEFSLDEGGDSGFLKPVLKYRATMALPATGGFSLLLRAAYSHEKHSISGGVTLQRCELGIYAASDCVWPAAALRS